MRKRLLSFVLALTLLISLLPMQAAAAATKDEDEIHKVITELITKYAKKVYRADAAEDAFIDFANHGLYGKGKTIYAKESDPLIAALFNSEVMKIALIEGFTATLRNMRTLHNDAIYVYGGPRWHSYRYGIAYTGYSGEVKDVRGYMAPFVRMGELQGGEDYTGPVNSNDEMMELIVGDLDASFLVKAIDIQQDTITYELKLMVQDRFNFEVKDNSDWQDSGFNTDKDDAMNKLGLLLTLMGVDEFQWLFNKTFTVTLSNPCDHAPDNIYRWTKNAGEYVLVSDSTGEYTKNPASTVKYTDRNTGNTINYFALENPVYLYHDAPWVLEYDVDQLPTFTMTPLSYIFTYRPFFSFHGGSKVWCRKINYTDLGGDNYSNTTNTQHYVGMDIAQQPGIYQQHAYTVRLENRVNADGSNMVYLTMYDHTFGRLVVDEVPMTHHREVPKGAETATIYDTPSNFISGMDFVINYIGNTNESAPDGAMELRIWENGTESAAVQIAPTCTEQGGMAHTCRDCGYSYITDATPAKGHSYGEYTYNNDAACTADGTKTRKCTACGVKDTVTAPDTAVGHSYKTAVTEPTYDKQGYTTYTCTLCGDSYVDDYTDVKQHSYTAVVTAPTCTEQGFTTYTCTECGDEYVDDYTELAAHTPVIDPAVNPTCVEKGKTEGSHCGVCGLVLKKQALISTVDTHRMEESIVKLPTYEEAGEVLYTCTDCGKTSSVAVPPLTKPVNPFTDVLETDWFYEPVLWAVENKVTGGKTETTFAPNEGCTRAQVVTFLWAANGKPEPTSFENKFTDVSDSDWYYNAVLWAVEQGITGGISATEFGPEQSCTRAQIVTFLWAAKGKPAVSSINVFVDVDDTAWYTTPIIWAAENDVTGGIGDGKFGPEQTCTRAQVVTFLKKIYG